MKNYASFCRLSTRNINFFKIKNSDTAPKFFQNSYEKRKQIPTGEMDDSGKWGLGIKFLIY
jgi:hypothetical protein